LKERQTNIYITSDEKIKKDCFIENGSIFSTEVPHQYQILLYQEGIKKIITDQT
jgi:hypothetical protein